MTIDTQYLRRCINTLTAAHKHLLTEPEDSTLYDIMRAACVKEFELVLEQSGKLLKKRLADYHGSPKEVARLTFKDIFRKAASFDLLSVDEVERWLAYRDNRNHTAHDYGEGFAETTLKLLPQFITDAAALANALTND